MVAFPLRLIARVLIRFDIEPCFPSKGGYFYAVVCAFEKVNGVPKVRVYVHVQAG